MKTVTEVFIVNVALENVIGYISDDEYSTKNKRDIHVFVVNVSPDTADGIKNMFNDLIATHGIPEDLVGGVKRVLTKVITEPDECGFTFYPIRPGHIIESDGDDVKLRIPIDTAIRPCEFVEALVDEEENDDSDTLALYYHSEQLYSCNMWRATFDTARCSKCADLMPYENKIQKSN